MMDLRATSADILPVMPSVSPSMAGILALITSSRAPWSSATLTATALAHAFGSALTGCLFEELRISRRSSEQVAAAFHDAAPEAHSVDREGDDFVAFAMDGGIHHVHWRSVGGDLPALLSQLGSWHNLAVLDRILIEGSGKKFAFSKALCATRIPCLIMPSQAASKIEFERIALAWDGSDSATRAIYAALPVILKARHVHILDGSLDTSWARVAAPRFDPYMYLGRLGLRVHARLIHSGVRAGVRLLAEAEQLKADLLIMGAYNHSRLEERWWGGTTHFVLEHAAIPVWMQH
ncbi:MAG TPA: universal stress protein [Dyella sp.]|uniref:universal stress protein n=1 Tax=Dyella sp. TaxID=1869338 RepID=UPI002F933774